MYTENHRDILPRGKISVRDKNGKCNRIGVLEQTFAPTPIYQLSEEYSDNEIYIKRDDLIPFSFGGNKARKAAQFYKEIMEQQPDVIMTYGSNSSNHCRIIANMAASMGLPCHIISPDERVEGKNGRNLCNSILVRQFGATVETCPVTEVADTIETRKKEYLGRGMQPYFIMGGGHGNAGTQAYVNTYAEILQQEEQMRLHFDRIVHASGTGTTQAGLICGKLLQKGHIPVTGISIARSNPRGREVVRESIRDYLGDRFEALYSEKELEFTDAYICGGYGKYVEKISQMIDHVMQTEGIPMDTTYVGKAFWGMIRMLEEQKIHGQKILFIHTGGTPLFFDRI